MSYEGSKSYREYALIEGINMLVNMVERTKEDKESLKKIHENWAKFNVLSFSDQIDLIYGTSTDEIKCRYMVYCINKLNGYMMSEFPNHVGRIKMLIKDVLDSINMAIMGDAHIWKKVQVDAIRAAFRSGRVAKSRPYYESKRLEDEEEEYKKYKKQRMLEYDPNRI